MYRPVVLLSYALNHWLGEYEPAGYHYVNLAIHIVTALMVSFTVLELTGRRGLAIVTAVVFAAQPLNSESVIYVSSRSESLCALFVLVSVWCYCRSRAERFSPQPYAISLFSFGVALGAKSIALCLPFFLILYDQAGRKRETSVGKVIALHLPFWLVSAAYLVITHGLLAKAVADSVRPLAAQWLTQTKALVYYLVILAMPTHLSVEPQFRVSHSLLEPAVLAAALALISGCALLWWHRRQTGAALWTAAALAVLAPTLIVPLNVLVNEHRLYLPSIAASLLVACCLRGLAERTLVTGAVIGLSLTAVLVALSAQRAQVWSSHERLWGDALAKAPHMPRPHLYVGDAHLRAGNQERALREYDRALAVYPEILSGGDVLSIYNNTGAAYLGLGRFSDGMEWYSRALQIDSTYVKARDALEGLNAIAKDAEDEEANRLKKAGLLAMVKGDLEASIAYFKRAIDLRFAADTYLSLGMAYERKNDLAAALRVYQSLPMMAPDSPYVRAARANAARLAANDALGR